LRLNGGSGARIKQAHDRHGGLNVERLVMQAVIQSGLCVIGVTVTCRTRQQKSMTSPFIDEAEQSATGVVLVLFLFLSVRCFIDFSGMWAQGKNVNRRRMGRSTHVAEILYVKPAWQNPFF